MKKFIIIFGMLTSMNTFANCKPHPELLNWIEEYKNGRERVAETLVKMKALQNPSPQEQQAWGKVLGDAKSDMSTHRNNIKIRYGKNGPCVDYVKEVFRVFPEP